MVPAEEKVMMESDPPDDAAGFAPAGQAVGGAEGTIVTKVPAGKLEGSREAGKEVVGTVAPAAGPVAVPPPLLDTGMILTELPSCD